MGDVRFEHPYRSLAEAEDTTKVLRALSDEEVISALAAASTENDRYLANVLASEAMNRVHRAVVISRNLGEGVVAVDTQAKVTYANPAAEQLLGYPSDEMLGETWMEVVKPMGPDLKPLKPEETAFVRVLGQHVTFHAFRGYHLTRKDGHVFPVALTAAPLLRDGEVVGAVGVFRDISEEVQREATLHESLKAFGTVVQEAPLPTVVLDPNGRVSLWNRAAQEAFGWAQPEVEGRDIPCIAAKNRGAFARKLARLREGESVEPEEVVCERKDGTKRRVNVCLSAIRKEDGALKYVVGTLEDVTDRRRQEEAERAWLLGQEQAQRLESEHRLKSILLALGAGAGAIVLLRTLLLAWLADNPVSVSEPNLWMTLLLPLPLGILIGLLVWLFARRERRGALQGPGPGQTAREGRRLRPRGG